MISGKIHEGDCPIKYNGKCFTLQVRYDRITYQQARNICRGLGGQPANIYSVDHYYILIGYIRMFASKDGYMGAWLGMTYNRRSSTLYLSNGRRAPYVLWYPEYPKNDECCNMCLYAQMDWSSKDQHLYTWAATETATSVICEKAA